MMLSLLNSCRSTMVRVKLTPAPDHGLAPASLQEVMMLQQVGLGELAMPQYAGRYEMIVYRGKCPGDLDAKSSVKIYDISKIIPLFKYIMLCKMHSNYLCVSIKNYMTI